jgi:sulfatase maturation enzyme AslB (radical SAM superfamily)
LSILSNLVVLSDELLQLLSNTGVAMGVSWDGVEDARLDLAGKPTHLRVLKNMRRLGEAGIRFGVNLVLGAHNHRLLPEIHDQILNLAAEWWAIHPVFRSTTPESVQAYVLSPAAAASSLGCLYRHWVIGGRAVCVQPLMRCERIVQGGGRASREMLHPRVFVRPDLQISLEGGTSSPTMILGSLRDGRTSDFQGSPTFEAALSRLRRQDSSIAEKLLCELLRNELQCNEISRFPDAGQGCLQHSV